MTIKNIEVKLFDDETSVRKFFSRDFNPFDILLYEQQYKTKWEEDNVIQQQIDEATKSDVKDLYLDPHVFIDVENGSFLSKLKKTFHRIWRPADPAMVFVSKMKSRIRKYNRGTANNLGAGCEITVNGEADTSYDAKVFKVIKDIATRYQQKVAYIRKRYNPETGETKYRFLMSTISRNGSHIIERDDILRKEINLTSRKFSLSVNIERSMDFMDMNKKDKKVKELPVSEVKKDDSNISDKKMSREIQEEILIKHMAELLKELSERKYVKNRIVMV